MSKEELMLISNGRFFNRITIIISFLCLLFVIYFPSLVLTNQIQEYMLNNNYPMMTVRILPITVLFIVIIPVFLSLFNNPVRLLNGKCYDNQNIKIIEECAKSWKTYYKSQKQ